MKYALQPRSQLSRKAPSVPKLQLLASSLQPPVLLPLCFHILTNCFSRNSLVFTFIRIAPGVTKSLCGNWFVRPYIESRYFADHNMLGSATTKIRLPHRLGDPQSNLQRKEK